MGELLSHLRPGTSSESDVEHDGRNTASYSLYIPPAYTGEEAWPLVVNLHFLGGSASGQITRSGMNSVANGGHFLVAYPNAW